MSDLPVTRPSLLLRARDPKDRPAWEELVALYAPLVYRYARKRGLQDADVADFTQLVFQTLVTELPRLNYEPRRGRFRGWLYTVVRNQLHKYLRGLRRVVPGSGDTSVQGLLEQQADREQDEAHWETEYQQRVFLWAADRVRGAFHSASWEAFWQTAVEGKSAREVADSLGLSVGAVYTARSRVLRAIQQEVRQLGEDEEGP